MKCPVCGGDCECDDVDNGIGLERIGPWGCPDCHWYEGKSQDDIDEDARAAQEQQS